MGKNKQNDRRQGNHDVGSYIKKLGPKTKRGGDKDSDGMLQRKFSLVEKKLETQNSNVDRIVSWPSSVGSP